MCQEFIARAVGQRAGQPASLDALAIAFLRLEYELPGWFRWELPDGAEGPRRRGSVKLSPVRERTRETALQVARRVDPNVPEAQIVPTELGMRLLYTLGSQKTGGSMLEFYGIPGGNTARANDWQPGENPPAVSP